MITALFVTLLGTAFTGWLMAEPGRAETAARQVQVVAPTFADGDDDEVQAGDGNYLQGEAKVHLKKFM